MSQEKIAGPGPHHPHMPNPSFWPIVVAFLQALMLIGFMLGRGGGAFDFAAFQMQFGFQAVIGVLMLGSMLGWIKEDPFADKSAA